ncbi:MAG: hypothetical protein ACFFGP_10340, partial [Promethearchaeota archaeon]
KLIVSMFVLLIFISIVFNLTIYHQKSLISHSRISNDESLINLRPAQNNHKAVNYSAISRNVSAIYRLFESVELTVNISGFTNVDYTIMQIDFSNNTVRNYNMTFIGNDEYQYVYSPKSYAPLGFQNVSFLIYNTSDQVINAHTTYTNFTIYTNYLASLYSFEYSRGDIVYAEFIVNDYDVYNFNWNVTVVDSISETNQNNLINLGNNIQQASFLLDDRLPQPDKIYYIKLNMTDNSPFIRKAAYVPFKVLNSVPQIVISSINFSKTEFKRTEECQISLNVSDLDPNAKAGRTNVSLILITPTGQRESPIILTNNKDWTFDETFSIAANKPIGTYQAILEAKDQYTGKGKYNTTLNIINNPPKIHNFWINGRSIEESIAINYGQDISFTFNISDVEDTIAYITVGLLDENNNWYNTSKMYTNNLVITLSSVNLITGVWYVYISVTDADGDTTYLTSDYGLGPKEIRIIPDTLSPILPWITLSIGVIFGVLLGIAFSYKRIKSKSLETPSITPKKKDIPPKRKKVKKTEELIKEEEIEKAEIEEEQERKPPQRKIKRKLK